MMKSMAWLMYSRISREDMPVLACWTSVRRRVGTSRQLSAWIVVREPSWPVVMAWSMSKAAASRHSPTMMRSGRWRRALVTRSR